MFQIWTNSNGGFETGIDIFHKEEQAKLQERAKRFALKPEEINNFTDENLQQLHQSLGVTGENDNNIRFEAIHMLGTDEMSTEDVLDYFVKYGPLGIEWIDDSCCNVVWIDRISAARALHFISKPINSLPVRGPCDPFIKKFGDEEQQEAGKSILLRNREREVQLKHDDENTVNRFEGAVDITEISCPIPPGFWRLGKPHLKAKNLLLRFACRTDKKPFKAEKFSEYYKKYGNPNFGGLKGLITEGRKQKFKGIFNRNRDIDEEETKNPWGGLAENWDDDARFREREYRNPDYVPEEKEELKTSGLLDRLGFKRAHDSEEEKSKVEKKSKVPRMKMYADEEEEKLKRKKQLMALKPVKQIEKNGDLRSRLETNIVHRKVQKTAFEEIADLGTKLKNRTRNTVTKSSIKAEGIKRSVINDRARIYHRPRRDSFEEEENIVGHKPQSKVAVVIKTQKKPAVASTIWSGTKEKGRFKAGRYSTSESSSSANSDSDSSSTQSEEDIIERKALRRPGFTNAKSSFENKISEYKSPLRIEINNDQFKKE